MFRVFRLIRKLLGSVLSEVELQFMTTLMTQSTRLFFVFSLNIFILLDLELAHLGFETRRRETWQPSGL